MFTRSIRGRFQLWLAFLLVVILTGFGVTAYQLHRTNLVAQIDRELTRRMVALEGALRAMPNHERRGPPPGGRDPGRRPPTPNDEFDDVFVDDALYVRLGPREVRLSSQVLGLFGDAGQEEYYFALWSAGGKRANYPTNTPADLLIPDPGVRDHLHHTRARGDFRETYRFNGIGECILVGRSLARDAEALRRFAWLLVAGGCGVLALGLGGGWWLVSRAIRPVEAISAAASRISAGNLSERINVTDTDNELGRLAGVLNSTFARLEAAFAQQKQFTADASHELRTPLAVLISETQTALSRERASAEYRETITACLDTAQQMRRLTESLLELARLDAGHEQLQRVELDLAAAARGCIERLRPLAAERGIQIHADLVPAMILGNSDQVSQVITNLVSNAIHYNKPNGEIRVSTRVENDAAILSVADTGIGIEAADMPHIFERFYRADKSRSRAEGRSGLGLAISRAIVEAHGGDIHVRSTSGNGSEFVVTLRSVRRSV